MAKSNKKGGLERPPSFEAYLLRHLNRRSGCSSASPYPPFKFHYHTPSTSLTNGDFNPMHDTDLIQMALGLVPPWLVDEINFSVEEKRIDIHINFERGGLFKCPECGRNCKAYDTEEKTWRHLNFFQHEAYLNARVPRVQCPEHKTHLINVPWARPGSGFTLMFEALVMTLVREMPVATVAQIINETDTRLWRILHHYVDEGRKKEDFSKVTRVGMDETASRRGHNYVSLFVDLDKSKVLFSTEGKDASTVTRFAKDFEKHNGNPNRITDVTCDMSRAFVKGTNQNLENAEITFDKFHVMKLVNNALDQVRREEQAESFEKKLLLNKTRYTWLTSEENRSDKQKQKIEDLKKYHLKTSRAEILRYALQDIYIEGDPEESELALEGWCSWARRCRLGPMKEAAQSILNHWDGVVAYFRSGLTNAVLEGINSLVQAAKSRARGYRNSKYLIAMIYLIAGKLDLGVTHTK